VKADDAIRLAYENEILNMDLSDETFDIMLSNIENHKEVIKKRTRTNFLEKMNIAFTKIPFKEFAAVAAFIFILVAVPYSIKHYDFYKKNGDDPKPAVNNMTKDNNTKENNNTNIDSNTKKASVVNLADLIEFKHLINNPDRNIPQVEDLQAYTDLDEIKEKSTFSIDFPKYIPEGYVLDSTKLTTCKWPFSEEKNVENNIFEIIYKNSEGKTFSVSQQNIGYPDYIKNKLQYRLKGWQEISLKGLDSWFLNEFGIMIFQTKDRKYCLKSTDILDRDTIIKIAQSFNAISDTSCWPTEKHEYYTDVNEIREKIPFSKELPNLNSENYTPDTSELFITRGSSTDIYEVNLYYKTEKQKYFSIDIINEPSKPEEILKKCEKVTIGNSEVWLYPCDNTSGRNQVIFWKNNLYYNLSSQELSVDVLKNIAESHIISK